MTVRHRIRVDQLQVGAPLPVDVYDAANRLLLRRGNVIATAVQLERLIGEGLFSNQLLPSRRAGPHHEQRHGHDSDAHAVNVVPASGKPQVKTRVSVYAEVVAAARRLEALLDAPGPGGGFGDSIEELAHVLRKACALDPDAALAHIMFARDVRYPTRQHMNVAIVAALVLERIGNDSDRAHSAICAALTMNIAIQALQDVLYQQQKMTPEQGQVIKDHPAASVKQLEQLGVRDPVWLALVMQHHEFVDGSGYPHGLAGEAIAREAQVLGLADRYCAAVTERAYRPPVAPDVAIGFMRDRGGTALAPELIAELEHVICTYPPGTVVELFNRDVAIVVRRLKDAKHPVVYAMAPQNLRPFEAPRKRLTASNPQFYIERVLTRETIQFAVDPELLWPRTVTQEPPT